MKILILILLTSLNTQAANFATLDELKTEVKTVYTDPKFCPSECIAIDGHDLEVSELVEIMRPVFETQELKLLCYTGEKTESTEENKPVHCDDGLKDFCPTDFESILGHDADLGRPVILCRKQVDEESSGQFELKQNEAKKLAKEAKQKAEADAVAKAQEAKKIRQTEIKTLAQKSGNLTSAEIQRLLKSLAQEIEAK